MYFYTKPIQNQINPIEEVYIINNAIGNVTINIIQSNIYLLKVIDDCKIHINHLPYIIRNLHNYLEFILIIESIAVNKEITFNDNIICDSFLNPIFTSTNRYLLFNFFSYNDGYNWFGNLLTYYDYNIYQSIITKPIIYTVSYNNRISINNPRCLSTPFKSNTNLLTYELSDWKLTKDKEGLDIIQSDTNISDENYHEFNSSGLVEDEFYYAFVRHYSLNKYSKWSNPIKIQVKNRDIANPSYYRKEWFTYVYYEDTRIHHWYDPTLITRWVKTNSNNTDIISVIDSTIIGNATILGNQHIELNGIQGLLTSIKIYFTNSGICNIRLIPDEAENFVITCQNDGNYNPCTYSTCSYDGVLFNHLNLFIYSRLKIIFNENCIITHIDFTLI